MRRSSALIALIACTAGIARAHLVPIPPSVCTFDPLTLEVPATGQTGAAQPPVDADAVRIMYDAGVSQLQVCASRPDPEHCGPPVPRAFTLGAITGTLAFPAVFPGRVFSSGDVVIGAVPVTFDVGGDARTVPVTFTTALAAVNGGVVEGVPLQGLASFTVVGVAGPDGLPAALGGQSLLVRMACVPRPVPDVVQFAPIPAASPVGGVVASQSRLRWTVDLLSSSALDFTAHPAMLAMHLDGQTVATALFSAGLSGGARSSATSDDGHTDVKIRQSSPTRFVVDARVADLSLPPETAGGRVLVDVVLDVAGLLVRAQQLFHVAGGKLVAR